MPVEPPAERAERAPECCALGGVLRPAAGCLTPVYGGQVLGLDDFAKTIRARLPSAVAGGERIVVEGLYRLEPTEPWTTVPARVWAGRRGRIELPWPGPPEAEARLRFHRLPARSLDRLEAGIAVAAGARLVGELGLHVPLQASGRAVRFRIDVEDEGAARTLLDRSVDPEEEGDRWISYALSLDEWAGRQIALRFRAEPLPKPDSGNATPGRSFPLFSRPRLVAPRAALAAWPDGPVRDLLLVSFDTLRADHLGIYGVEPSYTPHLDAFAARAVVFESAQTTFPTTTASHMSMLTGLYPRAHGVRQPVEQLARGLPTAAQLLATAGFATAAVTENGMLRHETGIYRGFDRVREFRSGHGGRETPGHIREVFAAGLEWLEAHPDERTFLFLHTYQVHGPYEPPEGFDPLGAEEPGIHALEQRRRRYAGEIEFADAEFGKLLEALERLGRLDRTAIVVTADHGEGFGDHGVSVSHGRTLYQNELHVPLVVSVPGGPAGRRTPLVSLADLTPTLLELAGIEHEAVFQGRSLVPLLASREAPGFAGRAVFSEQGEGGAAFAARRGSEKWILDWRGQSLHFDLGGDPGEEAASVDPAALARGRAVQRAYDEDAARVRAGQVADPEPETELDPATEAELRALGYIE